MIDRAGIGALAFQPEQSYLNVQPSDGAGTQITVGVTKQWVKICWLREASNRKCAFLKVGVVYFGILLKPCTHLYFETPQNNIQEF